MALALADGAAERSHSPPADRRHRCTIALTAEQRDEILRTQTVPREWFAPYEDCVPVKTSITMAVAAWQQASHDNRDQLPPYVLMFTLSLGRFYRWIDTEMMKKSPPRVGGYRIYQDVHLPEVDPQWRVLDY